MNDIDQIQQRIAQLQVILERERSIWDSPFSAPGAFVTGRSNRPKSLDRMLDAENKRKSEAFKKWNDANHELKHLQTRLKLIQAGEVHTNGQPVANSPSRQRRQKAEDLYADVMKSILKVGDSVALADNPRNQITIKRLNKKSLTSESGSLWKYAEILPLNEAGNAMSDTELRQVFKQYMAEQSGD